MTNPTNTDLAEALREIADTVPLGSALVVRLAADQLDTPARKADPVLDLGHGWIEWTGGYCPDLPLRTRVDVVHRDGDIDTDGRMVAYWKDTSDDENNWFFSGGNDPAEIIAYRIHK